MWTSVSTPSETSHGAIPGGDSNDPLPFPPDPNRSSLPSSETSVHGADDSIPPSPSDVDFPPSPTLSFAQGSDHSTQFPPVSGVDNSFLIDDQKIVALAAKCLECLNNSLRRNIFDLPEDNIGQRCHSITNPSGVSEALRYSCLYWASHLAETLARFSEDAGPVLDHLRTFVDEHLFHWFECLSGSGELKSGLISLSNAGEAVSRYSERHVEYASLFEDSPKAKEVILRHSRTYGEYALLLKDAHRCLLMSFELIEHHCLNAYCSALTWIPTRSPIRQKYSILFHRVPRVLVGLPELWGPSETIIREHRGILAVAFSPDGTQVVCGSRETNARIWSAITGAIECTLVGHADSVTSVAFSPHGTHIVSGSYDRDVRIWNVATGVTEHILEGHSHRVRSVAFSPDGTRIVSGSDDMSVRIWNATMGNIELILNGHTDCVRSVAFSPDGTRIASGSNDTLVLIWNTTSGELERQLVGHMNWVTSVAFSPDGRQIASGSSDKRVRIWNTNGKPEHLLQGHSGSVTSVAFSADGRYVVSGSKDNTFQIWDATTDTKCYVESHLDRVTSVAFSPDGTRIVSGSKDKSVRICETSDLIDRFGPIWKIRSRIFPGESKGVLAVAFSADGTRVAAGSCDWDVQVWDLAAVGRTKRTLEGHMRDVTSVAFSPDGTRIVSGSKDMNVRIWDAIMAKKQHILRGHSNWVTCVAFSADGTRVASGSRDKTVRLWNATTGETECVLRGYLHELKAVAFSRDGTRVVSNSVRIWDITTGESTPLSEFDFSQIPAQNTISRDNPDWFQAQQEASLSEDRKWILTADETCWIPPKFQDFDVHAVCGSKVCLAYRSGYLVVVDLRPAAPRQGQVLVYPWL